MHPRGSLQVCVAYMKYIVISVVTALNYVPVCAFYLNDNWARSPACKMSSLADWRVTEK